jgi:2',3'-cyclic-nucleotide 2'-phosphodiesterase
MMRALLVGDVVGNPGRDILVKKLAALRQKRQVDFVIANVENASGGSGLTIANAREILAAGVDVMTMGDHVWKRKEIVPFIEREPRLLRPLNLSPLASGTGVGLYTLPSGVQIGVLDLLGRVFMKPVDDPFRAADEALRQLAAHTQNIFVDFHAEATAEKITLGAHLDGRVTCVFGTHTHVPTADEHVTPKGTAFICDVGMTGPYDSVLGRRTDRVLKATLTQMPFPFDVAKDDVRISGALVTFDPATGRATAIERLQLRENEEP